MSKSIFVGSTVPYVLNSYNTCLGYSGMYSINGGTGNVSVGTYALGSCVLGSNNAAIGTNSLASCTGSTNVAVGTNSSLNLLGSTGNTTIGFNSYSQGTGSSNTVIGAYAGYSMTGGSYNTILGYNAGSGFQTGTGNIIIGANATPNPTGSYQLVVGDTNFQANAVGVTGGYDYNGSATTQQLNYLNTIIGNLSYIVPLTMTGFNTYHAEFYTVNNTGVNGSYDTALYFDGTITNQFPSNVLRITNTPASGTTIYNVSGDILNLEISATVVRADAVTGSAVWVLYYFFDRSDFYTYYSSTNNTSASTNMSLSSTFNYMTQYTAQLNTVIQLNPTNAFSVHIQNQSTSPITYGTLKQFVGSSYGVTLLTTLQINKL